MKNDLMKIALINTIKPAEGTGDGMTEYTYQLYSRFSESNSVDLIYSVDKLIRNNVKGLLYTNTIFKNKISKIKWEKYDIVHITNQEMGFAAKLIKKSNSRVKVITTIQDFARVDKGVQKGMLQRAYNRIVRGSIVDAFKYSDLILFTSSQTEKDADKYFRPNYKKETIHLAVRESILKAPIHKKRNKIFTVGYVGSLAFHKNVIMILKTANLMKDKSCNFIIYGKGIEYDSLLQFKNKYELKNVKFMGFAPENEIAKIYDSFDAFMFPSMYEGFGLPILEAQSRGLPVIVYRKGKVPKEVTRYCFKAGSPKDASRIITGLQKRGCPEEKHTRATKYARNFSWDACAKNTMRKYISITKRD